MQVECTNTAQAPLLLLEDLAEEVVVALLFAEVAVEVEFLL